MGVSQIVSVAVFVVAMALIMSEKMHRSLVAIVGAMLLLILHVLLFRSYFLQPVDAPACARSISALPLRPNRMTMLGMDSIARI